MNIISIALMLAVLSSCAKIQVKTPASRFVSPEAQGKLFAGSIQAEQQTGLEGTLDLSGDRTDNPLELRNNVSDFATSLHLGLLDKLDFFVKGHANAPSVYNFKYQVLGSSRKDAQKGNHALAISIGYGQSTSSQTEEDTSIFNNQDDEIEAELEHSLLDASIIYGYRPENDTLVYGSIQVSKQDVNFELDIDGNDNLNGKKFTLNTWAYGVSIGAIRYFEKYSINLESSLQRTDWNRNDPGTYGFIQASLAYKWD